MTDADFVSQLYSNLFGRDADADGLEYWVNMLESGTLNAAEVTHSFVESSEFSEDVAPIIQLYFAVLGRLPDVEGLFYWAQAYHRGISLDVISASMMASDEYEAMDGSRDNGEFIDQLYQSALNRVADEAGKAYWLDALNTGLLSRAEMVSAFARSDEAQRLREGDLKIIASQLAVLGEVPDSTGITDSIIAYQDNAVGYITRAYASDNYNGVAVPGLSKSGVAVDGYVSGATVTLTVVEKINGEWVTRIETRITDENGRFDFGEDAGFGSMVMTGGTDISTGAVFEGSMSAPAGATVINPLTTLVNALSQQTGPAAGNTEVAAANQQVLETFGLPGTLDLLHYDPVETATGVSDVDMAANALAVQTAAAQTNTLLTQVAAVLDGLGVVEDEVAGEQAAQAALVTLLQQSETVDLTDVATITAITQQASAHAGASDDQQTQLKGLIDDSANAIAQFNKAIREGAANSSSAAEGLGNIAQVQVVAEALEEQLETAVEQGDLSGIKDATEDAQLDGAIAEQEDNVSVSGDSGAVYVPDVAPPTPSRPRPPADRDAPVISGVEVNTNGHIEITWSEALSQASLADVADYTVTLGGNPVTISSAALSGTTVTLTLASPLHRDSAIESVAYARAGGTADSIVDSAGNVAADQTVTTITNNGPDLIVPVISAAQLNSDGHIEITWSEALGQAAVADVAAYTVTVGGSAISIDSATLNGSVVTLVPTDFQDQNVTIESVAYSSTGGTGNTIVDAVGNAAIDQTVTDVPNNSGPVIRNVIINADGHVEVIWSEDISGSATPNIWDYTLTVAGQSPGINSAAFKAGTTDTVVLTMASPLAAGTAIEGLEYLGYSSSIKDSDNNTAPYNHKFDPIAPELQESISTVRSAAPGASVITLEFNEAMALGTGSITLDDGAGGQQVIDVSSGNVLIGADNTQVIVKLDTPLAANTSYSVNYDATALTDAVGNAAPVDDGVELSFTTGEFANVAVTDTTKVVFDMVNGVSSDHSGRSFDANTSYEIYIRFGATDQTLNTQAQPGAASDATFAQWIGADNLGSDDKIWFATDTGDMPWRSGTMQADRIDLNPSGTDMAALQGAGGNSVGQLSGAGVLTRYDTSSGKIDLWLGEVTITQNMIGTSLASNVNTLLGTQGLIFAV